MLTEFHDLQHLTDVPQTVLVVLEHLAQPLPSSAAHRQHGPSVASVASTYDGAAIERPHHATENYSSELDNHIDFISRLSSSFAQLTNIDDQCGPRHTRPLWNMFFRHMGHASHDQSVIRNQVYVALPKGSSTLEETATMLISCVPTKFHHVPPSHDSSTSSQYYSAASSPAGTSQGFTSDNNSSGPPMISPLHLSETRSTSHYEHAQGELVIPANADADVEGADASLKEDETGGERESQEGVSSVSEEIVESTDSSAWNWLRMPDPWDSGKLLTSTPHPPPAPDSISSQLPLDVHVVAGAGPQTRLILPVVCVADPGSIIPLLSSIVYQRWVWSTDLPVVGVAITEYSSVARLHVAWMDSKGRIHVATPRTGTDTIGGVFDMAKVDSAMLFAQFLISLRCQFTALLAAVASQQPRSLSWRYDSGSPIFSGWYDRTLAWVNTIDCEDETNISESVSGNTQSCSADGVILPRKNSTKGDGSKTSPDTLLPSECNRSVASAKSSPVGSSREFCSIFAGGAAGELEDDATITTWMCHRSAIQVPFTILPAGSSREANFVNNMLAQYNAVSGIAWPANWTTPNKLPLAGSKFCSELWEGYEEHCCTSKVSPPLPDGLVSLLSANFPALRGVAAGAYNKDSRGVSSNKTEERYDWDSSLYHFLVTEGQYVSPHVLMECDLVFSSNPVLRLLKENKSYDALEVREILMDWVDQCIAVRAKTLKDASLSELEEQAVNALSIANDIESLFNALRRSEKKFYRTVRKQAKQEPRKGKCDAIFFLPIEGTGSDSFKFVKCSKRPQRRQHSDDIANKVETSAKDKPRNLRSRLNSSLSMNPLDGAREDIPTTSLRRVLPAHRLSTTLLLPCLVVEHKKGSHKSIMEALNKVRMHCVSGVHFLAAIGIREWPVYGLVTNGSEGAVIMASMSQYGAVHVFDRNPVSFDLSKALDVYRFATFLLRLRAQSEELRARFEEVRVDFERRLKAGELDDWGMKQGAEEPAEEAESTQDKEVVALAASVGDSRRFS